MTPAKATYLLLISQKLVDLSHGELPMASAAAEGSRSIVATAKLGIACVQNSGRSGVKSKAQPKAHGNQLILMPYSNSNTTVISIYVDDIDKREQAEKLGC